MRGNVEKLNICKFRKNNIHTSCCTILPEKDKNGKWLGTECTSKNIRGDCPITDKN
jgi:hypothetical protein